MGKSLPSDLLNVAMIGGLGLAAELHAKKGKAPEKEAAETVGAVTSTRPLSRVVKEGKMWVEANPDSGIVIQRFIVVNDKGEEEELIVPMTPANAVVMSQALHKNAAYVNKFKPKKEKK